MRKLSLEQATARYPHRFTMEHVPEWARRAAPNGGFYKPQFRTDREWYDNTTFPGEPGHLGGRRQCFTTGMTWPMGEGFDSKPFRN